MFPVGHLLIVSTFAATYVCEWMQKSVIRTKGLRRHKSLLFSRATTFHHTQKKVIWEDLKKFEPQIIPALNCHDREQVKVYPGPTYRILQGLHNTHVYLPKIIGYISKLGEDAVVQFSNQALINGCLLPFQHIFACYSILLCCAMSWEVPKLNQQRAFSRTISKITFACRVEDASFTYLWSW